ncbi:hypothetical protein N3K66_009070 [Trichothecium roseum]|uniref:Uncharacterized protein n=1 Tax=Trichothecium roseum TaxID=47278 RepID=A0ACC0UPL7_9HYPO|nr:hypothetical protein N3K66_009070 [Trichothecium roseum]
MTRKIDELRSLAAEKLRQASEDKAKQIGALNSQGSDWTCVDPALMATEVDTVKELANLRGNGLEEPEAQQLGWFDFTADSFACQTFHLNPDQLTAMYGTINAAPYLHTSPPSADNMLTASIGVPPSHVYQSSFIPIGLDSWPHIVDYRVFNKWNDESYSDKLRWANLENFPASQVGSVEIFHYATGPKLQVGAKAFESNEAEHTLLWGKSSNGWKYLRTPPCSLTGYKDLDIYIRRCIAYCVEELGNALLLSLYELTQSSNYELLPRALELWTANRLLMKGWQCTNTIFVSDTDNPYYGLRPAPRILQNQMDRHLERFIASRENMLATRIQDHISGASDGADASAAIVVILMVLEKDVWRLMYWTKHTTQQYRWRHPTQPFKLIERNIHSARLLLLHLQRLSHIPATLLDVIASFSVSNLHYCSSNDQSLDTAFTRYVLLPSDIASYLTLERVLSY